MRKLLTVIALSASLTACGSTSAAAILLYPVKLMPSNKGGALMDWQGKCVFPDKGKVIVSDRCVGPQWLLINPKKEVVFELTNSGLYLGRGKNNVATMGSEKSAVKIDVVGYGPNDTCVLGLGDDNSSLVLRAQKNGQLVWSSSEDKQADFKLQSGLDCNLKT